jgi:hypothetical protein
MSLEPEEIRHRVLLALRVFEERHSTALEPGVLSRTFRALRRVPENEATEARALAIMERKQLWALHRRAMREEAKTALQLYAICLGVALLGGLLPFLAPLAGVILLGCGFVAWAFGMAAGLHIIFPIPSAKPGRKERAEPLSNLEIRGEFGWNSGEEWNDILTPYALASVAGSISAFIVWIPIHMALNMPTAAPPSQTAPPPGAFVTTTPAPQTTPKPATPTATPAAAVTP